MLLRDYTTKYEVGTLFDNPEERWVPRAIIDDDARMNISWENVGP